jgi:hypothetical protein
MEMDQSRRDLLLASLMMAAPFSLGAARASPLDPTQTIIRMVGDLAWKSDPKLPARSVEMCPLFNDINGEGLYYTLVRWWPGYMSAPHLYASDRLCVVVSGTWWCNSGEDFDPAACVPVPTGSFVRRVAGTWHYDGVIRNHNEPVVIAICGIAPVKIKLADPTKSLVREV